jgi:hypothetical protein
MKSFAMNIFFLFLFSTTLLIDFSLQKLSKKKRSHKRHITIDKNPSTAHLSHVVRRTPTVTYKASTSKIAKRGQSSTMSFSNSNTHNGGPAGSPFGRSAHIVNPSVVFHGKGTISAVQETPAHVGWRRERQVVSSLNKKTHKVEKHHIESKTPLIGMVQQVKTLNVDHARKYDINQNTMGAISTSITNPDIK